MVIAADSADSGERSDPPGPAWSSPRKNGKARRPKSMAASPLYCITSGYAEQRFLTFHFKNSAFGVERAMQGHADAPYPPVSALRFRKKAASRMTSDEES